METLKIQMEEKKAREVRATAMQMYGHKKGAISMALNHAIEDWLNRSRIKIARKGPPEWGELRGTLKKENMSAVELQHHITRKLWPETVD